MTAQIAEGVHWVGAIDWNLREFHGYSTPFGSTYNAYLILDDEPVLIDTVKQYCFQEMIERIRRIIDPEKIRYIVSNHTEMDHSGSIEQMRAYCPKAQIVCSPKGREGLRRHFKQDWPFKVVATGDALCIGKRTLRFILMPMVHWPDSMATYSAQDALLFSNDAFGQHYASSRRFTDEESLDIVTREAVKYYANIVTPYGAQVQKVLEAVAAVDIGVIAPSHGFIWRTPETIAHIIGLYKKWAAYEARNQAVIVYDTMWHSTEMMAQALCRHLEDRGVPVKLYSLHETHISDVMTDIFLSKAVLVGSSILNNRILPSMASLLMYVKGLRPKNRIAYTFGSYGWSQTGFAEMEAFLKDAGMELPLAGRYVNFIPDQAELDGLQEIAGRIQSEMGKMVTG